MARYGADAGKRASTKGNAMAEDCIMETRNAVWNELGTIDCEINHPHLGWVPFTASPDDVAEHGRALFASLQGQARRPLHPLDRDGDGFPGGSLPASERGLDSLWDEYRDLTGQEPDKRWGEARLLAEIEAAKDGAE
jgi:hypothetical protein